MESRFGFFFVVHVFFSPDFQIINWIFRDLQGHGTPENGKWDPYYSHKIP